MESYLMFCYFKNMQIVWTNALHIIYMFLIMSKRFFIRRIFQICFYLKYETITNLEKNIHTLLLNSAILFHAFRDVKFVWFMIIVLVSCKLWLKLIYFFKNWQIYDVSVVTFTRHYKTPTYCRHELFLCASFFSWKQR